MQLSTRSRDYIIDTLALRSHVGAALARPFADADILKVLHGADSDVLWLQKDFGLFLVNMMDTGQAASILDLPKGLAALLQHFCQVSVCSHSRNRHLAVHLMRRCCACERARSRRHPD